MTSQLIIETENKYLEDSYFNNFHFKGDSGFDLYCPESLIVPANSMSFKINLQIKTQLSTNGNDTGYMLLPRSSTGSKTPLRLSNSVGIIDASYRGFVMAVVDNVSNVDFKIDKGDRLFQIVPFHGNGIEKVTLGKVSQTERGEGGFGSTGK